MDVIIELSVKPMHFGNHMGNEEIIDNAVLKGVTEGKKLL